jgi:hypothetical protein
MSPGGLDATVVKSLLSAVDALSLDKEQPDVTGYSVLLSVGDSWTEALRDYSPH